MSDEDRCYDEFELTQDHVALLRTGTFCYGGSTFGLGRQPTQDASLCRALGHDPDDVTPRQLRAMRQVLLDTERALKVVLSAGSFEPGLYVQARPGDAMSWRRAREGEGIDWWANGPEGPVRLTRQEAQDDVDAWSCPRRTGP